MEGQVEVELDDTVELICSAKSIPAATYTWRFNDSLLSEKTTKLSITKALYKNSGNYTCEAHNSVTGKKAASSHFLSVKGELNDTGIKLFSHQLQK